MRVRCYRCGAEIDVADFGAPELHAAPCDPIRETREFANLHGASIDRIARCEKSCDMVGAIVDNSSLVPFVYADAPFAREHAPALFNAMKGLSGPEAAAVAFAGWLACKRAASPHRLMLVLCACTPETETTPEMRAQWLRVVDEFERGDWGAPSSGALTERSPEVLRALGAMRTASISAKHDCVLKWMVDNGLILKIDDERYVELKTVT